jgi:hypothetical protein
MCTQAHEAPFKRKVAGQEHENAMTTLANYTQVD